MMNSLFQPMMTPQSQPPQMMPQGQPMMTPQSQQMVPPNQMTPQQNQVAQPQQEASYTGNPLIDNYIRMFLG